MNVRLSPETEARLNQLAAESGRPADELVEDAMAAYLSEVAGLRRTLDDRYDDVKVGRVVPVNGEEFFEKLSQRNRTNER